MSSGDLNIEVMIIVMNQEICLREWGVRYWGVKVVQF